MTGPETLTETESNAMLEYITKRSGTALKNRKSARNRLIFLLMLDGGLRINEALLLTINDLFLNDEPRHTLKICGATTKNNVTRLIPLTARIKSAIQYAHEKLWTEHDLEVNSFAFAGRRPTRPITARQVENIVGLVAEAAIGRHIHPHILRHTFASRLMQTCNARVVQGLLGHKHLTSTQIYMHPNQDDYKKAIDSLPKGGD